MNNIDKTLEALLRKIFNTDDFIIYVFSHIKSDSIKEELVEIIKQHSNITSDDIILMLLEHKQQGYKSTLSSLLND